MRPPARALLTVLISLLLSSAPLAASRADAAPAPAGELTLRSSFQVASAPLTTEAVWSFDPTELNPHRRGWVLERSHRLEGLKARELGGGQFGVAVDHLEARTVLHLRTEGSPYFSKPAEFPCASARADERFATRAGAARAGREAAARWETLLRDGRVRLALRLERLRAPTAEGALIEARGELGAWLLLLEERFDREVTPAVRADEWAAYRADPVVASVCAERARRRQTDPAPRPWVERMEPVAVGQGQLLARAPARRWGSRYTVRVNVHVGERTLTGQFLIDTSATHNLISPWWMRGQGLEANRRRIRGEHPERLAHSLGRGVGEPIQVDAVSIAGHRLPIRRFLLSPTEDLLGRPEFIGPCCDGVLSAEFLRHVVAELVPGPPSALQLYERRGFTAGADWRWSELSLRPDGAPVSEECALGNRIGPRGPRELTGAFWNTGAGAEALAPPPVRDWQYRDLRCTGAPAIEGLELRSRPAEASLAGASRAQFAIGAKLFERGNVVFDAPHGRVWLSPALLRNPRAENHSGLRLEARGSADGERSLVVAAIEPGSLATRVLAPAGLRPGMALVSVGGLAAADLDVAEAERHLRGAYGRAVALEWAQGGRTRRATLSLPDVTGVDSQGSRAKSPIPDTRGSLMNPK